MIFTHLQKNRPILCAFLCAEIEYAIRNVRDFRLLMAATPCPSHATIERAPIISPACGRWIGRASIGSSMSKCSGLGRKGREGGAVPHCDKTTSFAIPKVKVLQVGTKGDSFRRTARKCPCPAGGQREHFSGGAPRSVPRPNLARSIVPKSQRRGGNASKTARFTCQFRSKRVDW